MILMNASSYTVSYIQKLHNIHNIKWIISSDDKTAALWFP